MCKMPQAMDAKRYGDIESSLEQMRELDIIGDHFVTKLIHSEEKKMGRRVIAIEREASAHAMEGKFGAPAHAFAKV